MQSTQISDISGLSHGVGWCAPQQGTCKLTLNVKDGIVQEALVETIGCSGMTHSAAMAAEILPGKTLLECLNTDLVCDAINVAMRETVQAAGLRPHPVRFLRGRPAHRRRPGGSGQGPALPGGHHVSPPRLKGVRYLEMAEGYVLKLALDEDNEVIGYQFVQPGQDAGGYPSRRGSRARRTKRTSDSMAASTAPPSIIDPACKNNLTK